MDADGLPLIGSGIDFFKVEPIAHKRSLACVNHFVMNTVGFLNRFSAVCEEKLEDLTIRIQCLETTMNILEAKISSIPGLDGVTIAKTTNSQPQPNSVQTAPQNESSYQQDTSRQSGASSSTNSNSVNNASDANTTLTPDNLSNENLSSSGTMSAANDPRYAKFFTLMKHGVPKEALTPKILMEGLDPSVLDNPLAPVTSPAQTTERMESKNNSDFSDSDDQNDSLSDSRSSSDEDLDD